METHRIAIVVGTRPEAIKCFPLVRELKNQNIETILISTGQQRQLIKETLSSLKMSPDYDLDLMTVNQSPAGFLTKALGALDVIFENTSPTLVIVQGDTLSAYAGALCAYFRRIPIGHVEAGLRSHDLYSPWPEEGIRRGIDSIANYLWVPTSEDVLKVEKDQKVSIVGNTVVDALRILLNENPSEREKKDLIIVTLHRRESFGELMTLAMRSLIELSKTTTHEIVFIEHPNPNVRKSIQESELEATRIKIMSPIPYLDFIKIFESCALLITDSGGLQEEATVLGIPTVILREKTERISALDPSRSKLSPPDGSELVTDSLDLMNRSRTKVNFTTFGDGFTSARIVSEILEWHND